MRALRVLLVLVALSVSHLWLSGCSATQTIAEDSNRIAVLASEEKASASARLEGREGDPPKVTIRRMEEIGELADEIGEKVTQTKDNSWLDRVGNLLEKWATALIVVGCVVGAVVFLWFTPIGAAIRASTGLIPTKVKGEVNLALDAQDDPKRIREYIATKRVNPVWDAQYRKAKRARKGKGL